ncbi:MAG: DUF1572 domain-containing protein [Bacteroidota bacterium]
MSPAKKIADQFREVYLSGQWIARTNLKQELSQVTWQEAQQKVGDLNTIAILAYHLNYYVAGVAEVLEGKPLSIRDKYSFEAPMLTSQADWEQRQTQMWQDGERFAQLVEQLPNKILYGDFVDPQYGTNFRNLTGMIEHCYYHLGQIVLIRKLLKTGNF